MEVTRTALGINYRFQSDVCLEPVNVFSLVLLPNVVSAVSYTMSRRVFQLSSALSVSIPKRAVLIDSINF